MCKNKTGFGFAALKNKKEGKFAFGPGYAFAQA